jgi:hypothetical protein
MEAGRGRPLSKPMNSGLQQYPTRGQGYEIKVTVYEKVHTPLIREEVMKRKIALFEVDLMRASHQPEIYTQRLFF